MVAVLTKKMLVTRKKQVLVAVTENHLKAASGTHISRLRYT
jgi:hypothetical protein